MYRSLPLLLAGVLAFGAPLLPSNGDAQSTTVPDVEFLVLRLDYLTYAVKGGYRVTQPYRKTLEPEGFTQTGNVYVQIIPACDFGYTEVRSRLTGQVVTRATTVWAGHGSWQIPAGPLQPMDLGGDAPDPAKFDYADATPEQADTVWTQVRHIRALEEIAATGPYEVYIYEHPYAVGFWDPTATEWVVIAFSHPPAPVDVGIVTMPWPYTVIQRNAKTTAEVRVFNFSDSPQSFGVSLRVERDGVTVHEAVVDAGEIEADAEAKLAFPAFVPTPGPPFLVTVEIVDPSRSAWSDAFPDNDTIVRDIDVSEKPVFRPVASLLDPWPAPTKGVPVDLDGDGDQDIVVTSYPPRLLQRQSDGSYRDITDMSQVVLPSFLRSVMARDFTGDSHPDLLMTFFEDPPLFLRGDGTGAFVNMTAESGLGSTISYYDAEALDLENDGDLDLIFQSHHQEQVFANDGFGHFTNVTANSGVVDPSQTEDVAVGDVNGDGYTDVFLTNWDSPSKLFVNDGDGTFTDVDGPWTQIFGRKAIFLDCDGDGLQDILLLRMYSSATSMLFRNLGGLHFEDVSAAWGIDRPAFGGDVADLDHDGLPEVALTTVGDCSFLSSNGASFIDITQNIVRVGGGYGLSNDSPYFVDLNLDGLLDLYQEAAVYFQTGGGQVDPPPPHPPFHVRAVIAAPNPFRPRSQEYEVVSYTASARAVVEVSVYDVAGRMVRRLYSGAVQPGEHTVSWDGRDDTGRALASGVYFYTIESQGERTTGRIVILR